MPYQEVEGANHETQACHRCSGDRGSLYFLLAGLGRHDGLLPYLEPVVHGGLAFRPAFGRVIDGNSRHLSMATLALRLAQ